MNISIDFKDAFILSIFCILIVFIVLMIISLSINIIKIFIYRHDNISNFKDNSEINEKSIKKSNLEISKIEDDEDKLIAVLVASIDAVDGNDNKTVKVKNIRQI